jgi:hypothetical protein
MNGAAWNWIETASTVLAEPEREAILGDLAESGDGFLSALRSVFDLAFRRHLELWANWRPWAASIGLALPASIFLMGISVAVSQDFLLTKTTSGHSLPDNFVGKAALLALWAFTAGSAAIAISRRTLWATAIGCAAPCLTCMLEWPGTRLSALRLLVFLLPAICGAIYAGIHPKIQRGPAFLFAASTLLVPLMVSLLWHQGGGLYGLGLLMPGCLLLTTTRQNSA